MKLKLNQALLKTLIKTFARKGPISPRGKNPQRILVLRRNRMGDMICTLPLLHALRNSFPHSYIKIICEREGEPIAQASGVANEVYCLKNGFNRWLTPLRNRKHLEGFDIAIGVKGGFDKYLALLVGLTKARYRIGFETPSPHPSLFYTHPLPPPPPDEHQIETCLRLLQPLDISPPPIDLSLQFPPAAITFAKAVAKEHSFQKYSFIVILNISSNKKESWSFENFNKLAKRLISEKNVLVGISTTPKERSRATRMVELINSPHCFALNTRTTLYLAAILKRASFVVTSEGGVAHLAAACNTPALILWQEGKATPKWRSRHNLHFNLEATNPTTQIPLTNVWNALQTHFLK